MTIVTLTNDNWLDDLDLNRFSDDKKKSCLPNVVFSNTLMTQLELQGGAYEIIKYDDGRIELLPITETEATASVGSVRRLKGLAKSDKKLSLDEMNEIIASMGMDIGVDNG